MCAFIYVRQRRLVRDSNLERAAAVSAMLFSVKTYDPWWKIDGNYSGKLKWQFKIELGS